MSDRCEQRSWADMAEGSNQACTGMCILVEFQDVASQRDHIRAHAEKGAINWKTRPCC